MRRIVTGLVATGLFLAIGCMVGCTSALQQCVAQKNDDCIVREARSELFRSQGCCECWYEVGSAEERIAFRTYGFNQPTALISALHAAHDDLQHAVTCKRREKKFVDEMLHAQHATQQIEQDLEPGIWDLVQRVEAPDDRIQAVLDHRRIFAGFCKHDIDGELNRYLGWLRSQSSDAIKARLPIRHDTSVAEAARMEYADALYGELVSTNDVDAWEHAREDLRGTQYFANVDAQIQRALRSRIERLNEPDEINAVCHLFTADEDKQACGDRVQRALVTKIESLENAEQIEALCPRLISRSDDEACRIRFQQLAVRAAEADPGGRTFAIARRACGHAECRRRVLEIIFAFEANNAYQQLAKNGTVNGPAAVSRSAKVWRQFIQSLDRVAVELFGHGASLSSIDPVVYADAIKRLDDARSESIAITKRTNSRWTSLLTDINSLWKPDLLFRSRWIPQIDQELRELLTAIQLDEQNTDARILISELLMKRRKLDSHADVQLKVAQAVFEIALGELTGYIPSLAGRLAVSVGYQVLRF